MHECVFVLWCIVDKETRREVQRRCMLSMDSLGRQCCSDGRGQCACAADIVSKETSRVQPCCWLTRGCCVVMDSEACVYAFRMA